MTKQSPVTHEEAHQAALRLGNRTLTRYVQERCILDHSDFMKDEYEVAKNQLIFENPDELGPYIQHCWDSETHTNHTRTVERIPSDDDIYLRVKANRQRMIENKLNGCSAVPTPIGDPTMLFDGIITEMRRVYEETKPLKWWQRRPKHTDGTWWGDDTLMINLFHTAIENAKQVGFIR